MTPPVVVHEPSPEGGRDVTAGTELLGRAYEPEDVVRFLRRAGLTDEQIQLDDANLVEWRGGGAEVWR
ncbi:hypothetical protein ACWGJ2_11500 [Streptomyces sp. NPDC054796]